MDKKTLLGFLLIGLILFGFSWYSNYQQKQFAREKAIADSIYLAEHPEPVIPVAEPVSDTSVAIEAAAMPSADSMMAARIGTALVEAMKGQEELYLLENERIKLFISSLGGRIAAVEVKEYQAYGGAPMMLFDAETSRFDLSFFLRGAYGDNQISTSAYHFTRVESAPGSIVMRLDVGEGASIDYIYTLAPEEYMVDFDIRFTGMQGRFSNQSGMALQWESAGNQNEKGFDNENNNSDLTWMYPGTRDDMERLGMSKGAKSDEVNHRVHWIAFKQQFFASILIADANQFERADLQYDTYAPGSGKIKKYSAAIDLEFSPQATSGYDLRYYFGPNKYSTLRKYDLGIEHLVPLGWGIFGWINRWIVIPVFDFLSKYISSFGLIILLLTIFIKLIISPLTYKSYLSTAKMRLLKPELDEINAKFPKQEDMAKKQQATMELYRKAGVSPMGGCLPLLIQFPFLIAMFRFFPAAIELRQQAFLWADDLSSYDSILDLPFNIPFYGDHVSLFALLMAVAAYFGQRIAMAQTPQTGQMAGMKFMSLYLMPLMMLLWFNNYSSALSYYYGLSSLITIVQTWGFRYAVDDRKLHEQMKANAKKPKKKSGWAERYEQMLKEQQRQQAANNKRR